MPITPRALTMAFVALLLCAALARGQEAELAPPGGPLIGEEEVPWLPQWTLPHPDYYEELWRPGALVEDSYWLRRPWSAGFFFGTMDGDGLSPGVDQRSDWFYGLRYGNDFAPHWGWELRSGFFTPDLAYANQPWREDFARDWFLDLNVLHYPWGDTRIRPFWSIGLGAAQFKYRDYRGHDISDWVVDMPLSVGCKYYLKPWLALRGELTDTLCFGNDQLYTMNNLSLTVGAEFHWHSFKTRPVKYGY